MTIDNQVQSSKAFGNPEEWVEGELSDDELTALALSCERTDVASQDAIPASQYLHLPSSLLPNWYMPAAISLRSTGWRRPVIIGLVAVFVVIEALGLCSTFGQVVIG